MAHGKYDRAAKKDKGRAAFGWDAFNQDTLHKAYEKRLGYLPKVPSCDVCVCVCVSVFARLTCGAHARAPAIAPRPRA